MSAPDSTGDRIVAAAVAEFSRYGIAGARIERIAKAARTSNRAQAAGLLDSTWDPVDILMFVNQIAMSWAGQADLVPADDREAFLAGRRAAIVEAVQRLFPAADR